MSEQQHYFSADPAGDFAPREISVSLGGHRLQLLTAGGVFSPDHLDRGTEVLLTQTPAPEGTSVLDLGCGWGPIAIDAALRSPGADVWAVDVNERSLELTRMNAERAGTKRVRALHPEEVPPHLAFSEIRSNPPIRVGKAVLHDLLRTWLPRLEPGGHAYLVVAKHLGANSLERWMTEEFADLDVTRYARKHGFHVIRATRLSHGSSD